MPRAFLITQRRYDEQSGSDFSPKRTLSTEDSSREAMETAQSSEESSGECPDELYNLTKLAEVAVATGQLMENRRPIVTSSCEEDSQDFTRYTHKLFDKSSRIPRPHLNKTDGFINKSPTNGISPCLSSGDDSPVSSSGGASPNQECHSCTDCGKRYSTSSNLARHRQTHRSPGDRKARRCPHCDKLYVSMPAYSMHVRTHNQGCRCQYCGKCFSRPWLLQGHIRTHTGEKPFKCTICGKAFADKSNLRAHTQTHSNTKPHVCRRCGKAFALKSYLYKHEESSCMRINGRSSPQGKESSSETVVISNHAPVIVSRQTEGVIKPLKPLNGLDLEEVHRNSSPPTSTRTPILSRSSVISPNPERIIYSTIEHPSVIFNTAKFGQGFSAKIQEEPMDFSTTSKDLEKKRLQNESQTRRYAIGFAIAV